MILVNENALVATCDIRPEALIQLKQDLTIDNPMVQKRFQLGLSIRGLAPHIKCFKEEGEHIYFPIGYMEKAMTLFGLSKSDILDKRSTGYPININFTSTLRPYQQQVLDSLKIPTTGVISAPTGSGKSVMMCALIAHKKVSTLILVNTIELANQFKANLLRHTDIEENHISIIHAGKPFKINSVTIALFQSMDKLSQEYYDFINEHVGMIITDEVHITGASTYFAVVNALSAKYKYGFSATPERDDGLTKLIFFASGPLRKEIKISEIDGNVMLPDVHVVETEYTFPLFDIQEYQAMITDLSSDEDRNKLIVNTINLPKYANKQKVLLCSRVIQCIRLQEQLPGSKILVGNISKEDQKIIRKEFPERADEILKQKGKKYRQQIVKELSDGTLTTVISTFKLFSTGLDFSGLEVAAFCAPMKSKVLVKQCRGRIMRVSEGKQPICIDFQDTKVEILKIQSKIRQRILRKFD